MLEHSERKAIQEKLLNYSLIQSGDEKLKYAYAFGSLWALMTDDQLKAFDKHLNEWSK